MSSFSKSGGVRIYAHQATCDDIANEPIAKMAVLRDLLVAYSAEKSLIFCGDDKATRKTTMAIELSNAAKTCIFTSDMYEDDGFIAHTETREFLQTAGKVATCSYETFRMTNLSSLKHYVFFEFPTQMTQFPTILEQIGETGGEVRVDVVVSSLTQRDWMCALTMEMHSRGMELPEWLRVVTLKGKNVPPPIGLQVIDNAVRSTNAPIPSPRTIASRAAPPMFDAFDMKPNAEGKYVIPFNCSVGANELELESDDDDLALMDVDSSYDEHQFDYENAHDYDLADEFDY